MYRPPRLVPRLAHRLPRHVPAPRNPRGYRPRDERLQRHQVVHHDRDLPAAGGDVPELAGRRHRRADAADPEVFAVELERERDDVRLLARAERGDAGERLRTQVVDLFGGEAHQRSFVIRIHLLHELGAPGSTVQSTQNSLPSGSAITTWSGRPSTMSSYCTVAPAAVSRATASTTRSHRVSQGTSRPPPAWMSKCRRFFATFPSGTLRKLMFGSTPSGSLRYAPSFHSASGTPWCADHASQLANPAGGGRSM